MADLVLPHHDYAYCLCPNLCGNEDFWSIPREIKEWNYRMDATPFGEEVIKNCKEETKIPEGRVLWQENFDFDEQPKETVEEIENDLKAFLDPRVKIIAVVLSKKTINFQFYTVCPIWYVMNELKKIKGNQFNNRDIYDVCADFIEELHTQYSLEPEGDKYRYRADWWKKGTLDLASQMHLLVKELNLENQVFCPADFATHRNEIIEYIKNKYPKWKLELKDEFEFNKKGLVI